MKQYHKRVVPEPEQAAVGAEIEHTRNGNKASEALDGTKQ